MPPVSRPPLFAIVAGILVLGGMLANTLPAQEVVIDHAYANSGQSSIKVTAVFGNIGRSGYLPFQVAIRNGTQEARNWTIEFGERGTWRSLNYSSVYSFAVPPGGEIKAEMSVPIPPEFATSRGYRNLSVRATVRGLSDVERFLSSNSTGERWPSLTMSRALSRRSLNALTEEKEKLKIGNDPFASSYDPEMLPTEWLGYTCLDTLMITDREWTVLPEAKKRAILEWIRLGGRCDIFAADIGFDPRLGGFVSDSRPTRKIYRISRGLLSVRTWNGDALGTQVIQIYRNIRATADIVEHDFDRSWDLLREFGVKRFNILVVFVLLVSFAIFVGPVNLFVFAKTGRRHLLFLTTPIISLVAILVMATIIFFEDGFGGTGMRLGFLDLQQNENEKRAYLTQEQVSRTGVMLSTGFTAEETISLTPVNLPDSRWNPLSRERGTLGEFRFTGKKISGDLFRSRNEQGYLIQAAIPSRSRIELRTTPEKGNGPEIFSSVGFPLKDILVIGPDARKIYISKADSVLSPGNSMTLDPGSLTTTGTTANVNEWLNRQMGFYSDHIKQSAKAMTKEPYRFFAIAAKPSDSLVETHPSIRWKNDFVIVTGTIVAPGEENPTDNGNE